ncbi:MAG: alpha/beta hydrolase [Saprospiraceae bacterium]
MNKLLFIFLCFSLLPCLHSQSDIPYGNNPDAGKYFDSDGVQLYYETYGSGAPLLLLHGGVYGYIDEFEYLIPKLAEHYQVICPATRGHGKSEIGHEPFTYQQRADDAYQLLQHLGLEKVIVIGFSDGGYAAMKMAALYPDAVTRVVAMGVGEIPQDSRLGTSSYSAESLLASSKDYFESRLKLMPEPERWGECLQMLNELYNNALMSKETFEKITCPVLLMNGDHDQYQTVDALVSAYHQIEKATLSIIPGCGHVILYCNFSAAWDSMRPFLEIKE